MFEEFMEALFLLGLLAPVAAVIIGLLLVAVPKTGGRRLTSHAYEVPKRSAVH